MMLNLNFRDYNTSALRIAREAYYKAALRLVSYRGIPDFLADLSLGSPSSLSPWRRETYESAVRFARRLVRKDLKLRPKYKHNVYLIGFHSDPSLIKITADVQTPDQHRLRDTETGEEYVIERVSTGSNSKLPANTDNFITFHPVEHTGASPLMLSVPTLLQMLQLTGASERHPGDLQSITNVSYVPTFITTKDTIQAILDQLSESLPNLVEGVIKGSISGKMRLPKRFEFVDKETGEAVSLEHAGGGTELQLTNNDISGLRVDLRAVSATAEYYSGPALSGLLMSSDEIRLETMHNVDSNSMRFMYKDIVSMFIHIVFGEQVHPRRLIKVSDLLKSGVEKSVISLLQWKIITDDANVTDGKKFIKKIARIISKRLNKALAETERSLSDVKLRLDPMLISNFIALAAFSIYVQIITNIKVAAEFLRQTEDNHSIPPVGTRQLSVFLFRNALVADHDELGLLSYIKSEYILRNVATNEKRIMTDKTYTKGTYLTYRQKYDQSKVTLKLPERVAVCTQQQLTTLVPGYRVPLIDFRNAVNDVESSLIRRIL